MPRAGSWLGRACRPGGSGSNHRGLDAGRRPWRPSWVAVRTSGQAGAKIRRELSGAGPGSCTLCLLPGRVDLRVTYPWGRFGQQYTVNVVLPLQRAGWRARPTAITAARSLKRRVNIRSSAEQEWIAFPAVAVRERCRRPGWPRGGVPNPLPHPRGRSDLTTDQAPWLVPCRPIKADAETAACPRCAHAAVHCGPQRSTAVNLNRPGIPGGSDS